VAVKGGKGLGQGYPLRRTFTPGDPDPGGKRKGLWFTGEGGPKGSAWSSSLGEMDRGREMCHEGGSPKVPKKRRDRLRAEDDSMRRKLHPKGLGEGHRQEKGEYH